jgi:hypothetical protein
MLLDFRLFFIPFFFSATRFPIAFAAFYGGVLFDDESLSKMTISE